MDGTQSKPKFFERLISRLAGEPDSAEDVLTLLRQAHEQEVFDADTLTRLEKVLDFAELEVRDAMITRSRMNVLRENDSIERITAYVIETAHSRFPVIGEDKDEVLGILHAKDLLKYMFNPEQFHLKSVLRPAVFVPEGKSLTALLKEFREQRNHMAIVIDEYGGTSGLVTFEDIIEQIVGEIEDEFDEDDSADNIHAVSSERWRIHAATEIEDINTFFGTEYSDDIALLVGSLGEYEKALGLVNDQAQIQGAMQKEAAAALNTTEGQINKAKAAVSNMAGELGDALLPILKITASTVETVATAISDFTKDFPVLSKLAVYFAAARVAMEAYSAVVRLGGAAALKSLVSQKAAVDALTVSYGKAGLAAKEYGSIASAGVAAQSKGLTGLASGLSSLVARWGIIGTTATIAGEAVGGVI